MRSRVFRIVDQGSARSRLRPTVLTMAVLLFAVGPVFATGGPMTLLPPVDFDTPDQPGIKPIPGEQQLAKALRRTPVFYRTTYPKGTVVVDTSERRLYIVASPTTALRYGIAVGRQGYQWDGLLKVSKKKEWPDWIPPKDMIAREAKKGKVLPAKVSGGPANPLGARALYLGNTQYRIHGTNQPQSIGKAASSGCFRMLNEHVVDVYAKVPVGTWVIVQK